MAAAAEHELGDFLNELVLKLRVLIESVPVHGGVNADVEDLLEELSIVQENVVLLDTATRVPERLFVLLGEARNFLQARLQNVRPSRHGNQQWPGRPSTEISRTSIEALLNAHFNVPAIAKLLHVSIRTLQRRMHEYGLSVKVNYSIIEDNALDATVQEIKGMNPHCGSKMLSGYLRAKGILIPRERIRKSLNRVDAVGIAEGDVKL